MSELAEVLMRGPSTLSVDGLDTWTPDDPEFYRERAAGIALRGYAGSASRG